VIIDFLERKIAVRELKMSLVVEFGKRWRIRVFSFEVHVVTFRILSCIATLFAHIDLVSPLFVRVIVCDAVHLQCVRFQRTPLRKRLVTVIAFVRTHTGMSASMSLQIKGIVETLAAECAQISLDITVTLQVSVKQTCEIEFLATYLTFQRVIG